MTVMQKWQQQVDHVTGSAQLTPNMQQLNASISSVEEPHLYQHY